MGPAVECESTSRRPHLTGLDRGFHTCTLLLQLRLDCARRLYNSPTDPIRFSYYLFGKEVGMDDELFRACCYTATGTSPSLLSCGVGTPLCHPRTATWSSDLRTPARDRHSISPCPELPAAVSEADDCGAAISQDAMRGDEVLRSKFIITRHNDMYFYERDVDLIIIRRPDCLISATTSDIPSTL